MCKKNTNLSMLFNCASGMKKRKKGVIQFEFLYLARKEAYHCTLKFLTNQHS